MDVKTAEKKKQKKKGLEDKEWWRGIKRKKKNVACRWVGKLKPWPSWDNIYGRGISEKKKICKLIQNY